MEDLALVLQVAIQQANVNNSSLGLLFIDLKKAYDSLDRAHLWSVLVGELGLPDHLINII